MAVKDVTGSERGAAQRYLLCTSDGTYFTSVSDTWQEVLGWTEEELRSRPFADFIHPHDRQRTMEEAAKVSRPGYEVVGFENRYRARYGQWRRLRWSGCTDGTCWVGVAIDVTDEVGTAPAIGPRPNAWQPVTTEPAAAQPVAANSADWAAAAPPGHVRPPWRAPVAAVGAALCLLTVVVAVNPPDIRLSGATSEPAWSGEEGPPALIGPVNRAGPLDPVALGADAPPRLLGPRPEPPGSLSR